MTVLIATPARLSTPRQLLGRVEGLVHSLAWSGSMEWRLHFNEQPAGLRHYEANARARNELIERYLKPWHEWVLWVDVDIVEMPTDLVKVLVEKSELWRAGKWPAVVAPMVWMERVKAGPVGFDTGGWFYDTGGFVGDDGVHADFFRGPLDEGEDVVMQSVGCVYLAPAELYRAGPHGSPGLRYEVQGHEVEHVGFCRRARGLGAYVVATRKADVTHAYLPKYGEKWHHRTAADAEVAV